MVNRAIRKAVRPSSPTISSSTSSQESPRSSASRRGREMIRDSANPLSAENLHKRGYHTLYPSFKPFHVENRWRLVRELGQGAYGMVISAEDKISGETVAIKMVTRVFDKIQLAKRALREVVLLRHFSTRGHENVTGLIDFDAIHPDFNEIYIFMEKDNAIHFLQQPMEADLHQIIRSGQQLTSEHVQYFLYQILRGMKYIHTASVLHRDLKPGNLLVNSDCELKICDFGLANTFEGTNQLTEYVATRWYRAPEIMLSFRTYGTAIDVWSIGCILAELLLGKPLFRGKDYVDQINRILDVLGTPGEDLFAKIASEKARAYMRSLPIRKPQSFRKIFSMADDQVVDLLTKMVAWDPDKRLSVVEALEHPWLANYHDPADEPICPAKFDRYKDYENLATLEEFRVAIWKEIQDFRKEVRNLHPPPVSSAPLIEQTIPGKDTTSERSVDSPLVLERIEEETPTADVNNQVLSEIITEEPSAEGGICGDLLGDLPPPTGRDHGSLVGSSDPIVSYKRRSSVLQGTNSPGMQARNSLYSHGQYQSFPSSGQPDGDVSYVVPARSRAASVLGGQSQRLRTLSTFSIHEKMDEAIKLLVATGADAPPSSIPQEFIIGKENLQ